MNQTTIVMLLVAPLVLWRMYARVQRLTTRQESKVWRHMTALIVFPLITLMLIVLSLKAPLALAAMTGGVAIGIGLAMVALSKTTFETVDARFYFTPHARIGMAVFMVFMVRMMYRFYEISTIPPGHGADLGLNPLTMAAFGLLAGYYTVYAAGLMRWRRAQPVALAAN